jgi:hypothetical protein
MRKWAKSWESLQKAEVNIGKILESARKYKHADARRSTRKQHAEARRSTTFPIFSRQYKSLLHILRGEGECVKAILWTACCCPKLS